MNGKITYQCLPSDNTLIFPLSRTGMVPYIAGTCGLSTTTKDFVGRDITFVLWARQYCERFLLEIIVYYTT